MTQFYFLFYIFTLFHYAILKQNNYNYIYNKGDTSSKSIHRFPTIAKIIVASPHQEEATKPTALSARITFISYISC